MVCLGNEQRSFCQFEIASKYCISDSFIDHDGYSISSEGYLKFLARQLRPAHFERAAVTGKLSAAERNYPTSQVRGRSQEDPMPEGWWPRGATPVRGQRWLLGGATPCPRSSGCMGAAGPRGAIPSSRSGGVSVRRYPSSKVRSRSCTLLEQL